MSMDSADDLHALEDLAGTLAQALRNMLDGLVTLDTINHAQQALASSDNFCRPTCEAEGSDEPDDCMEGPGCGCPCHDREDS